MIVHTEDITPEEVFAGMKIRTIYNKYIVNLVDKDGFVPSHVSGTTLTIYPKEPFSSLGYYQKYNEVQDDNSHE